MLPTARAAPFIGTVMKFTIDTGSIPPSISKINKLFLSLYSGTFPVAITWLPKWASNALIEEQTHNGIFPVTQVGTREVN